MQYRYVTEKQNYEDYAAGRVILSMSGGTSFPVRLASEIFQRCAAYFPDDKRLSVYDPCCGTGYLLTTIGFLHGDKIAALYGSDINPDAVDFASDNLKLLTHEGLQNREESLQDLANQFGKQSHQDALDSLNRLREKIPAKAIETSTWRANALELSVPQTVDLIICDVPYGDATEWQITNSENPLKDLIHVQYDALVDGGIIAIISDKKQKAAYPQFKRLQHETAGKRRFTILQKA